MRKVLVCGKREFPKLMRRTFEINITREKHVKRTKMAEMDKINHVYNLGHSRTLKCALVSKYLIG